MGPVRHWPQYRSNIDILSIWLERSKTCPLHIRLYLPIEPQCLSVLTSSVERWESLELIVLRVHRQISSVDIFPCLAPDDSDTFVFMTSIARCHETFIIALIETTPNLKFLSIDYRLDRHCAYSPLMDSLFNLSYLHLYYKALDCERTWNMLHHFGGTLLYLNCERGLHFYPSWSITFSNLKILSLHVSICPLLHASTLQILDLDIGCSYSGDPEWITDRLLLKMKLPLLALRIWSFECADGLDRFFQSPDIQAIPLVEIVISNRSSEMRRQRSCALGKAVMVEHWLLGTFVEWNRLSSVPHDLADYLSGDIDVPLRYLEDVDPPFNFFRVWNDEKMNSGVFENSWCGWAWSKLLRVSEGVQVEERVHLMKKNGVLKRSQW